MFPAYGGVPSTSRVKEEIEDEPEEKYSYRLSPRRENPVDDPFSSFNRAAQAKREEEKRRKEKLKNAIENIKDKHAQRNFELGDSDSDDCMVFEDEAYQRVAQSLSNIRQQEAKVKQEQESLEKRQRDNRSRRSGHGSKRGRRGSSSPSSSSSSSSTSSDDYSYRRKRDKKKKKKKEKKSRKDKDKYIESSRDKSPTKKKVKWDYLPTLSVRYNDPDSWMVLENERDGFISGLQQTETGQRVQFNNLLKSVLVEKPAQQYTLDKWFFPVETRKKQERFLSKPINFSANTERTFLNLGFDKNVDFIELSVRSDRLNQRYDEAFETAEERERREKRRIEDMKLAIEADERKSKATKRDQLLALKHERTVVNAGLRDTPKDEEKWLHLLLLEDEINQLEHGSSVDGAMKKSINERKCAILEKAVAHLPMSGKLWSMIMKIKKENGLSLEEMKKEWKSVMNRLPNSTELWGEQIRSMKHDGRLFNRDEWMKLVDDATRDLNALVRGTMTSHKPQVGTEEFILQLFVERVGVELAMGYVERAVTIVQGMIEMNVFSPGLSRSDQWMPFHDIWRLNLPILGEPGAIGMRNYLKSRSYSPSLEWENEGKDDAGLFKVKLVDMARASREKNDAVLFAQHERLNECYMWRPIRAEAVDYEDNDLSRMVELSDVPTHWFNEYNHLHLTSRLLSELGAVFYICHEDYQSQEPIGVIISQYHLLRPSLHRVPNGLQEFLDRSLKQLTFHRPDSTWNNAINMALARIRTRAWFISIRSDDPIDFKRACAELSLLAQDVIKSLNAALPKEDHTEISLLVYAISSHEMMNLFHINYDNWNTSTKQKNSELMMKKLSMCCLYSNGVPLDRVKGVIRTALMIFGTMICQLPESTEERTRRLLHLIMGRKCEKNSDFTIPEKIQATAIIKKLTSSLPEMMPHPSQGLIPYWLASLLGLDKMLSIVLEMNIMYGTTTFKIPSLRICATNSYPHVAATEQLRLIPRCYEKFNHHYIYLLKNHYNEYQDRSVLVSALEYCTNAFPDDPFFIRESVNRQQHRHKEAKLFTLLKMQAEARPTLVKSLGRIYAHYKQFTRVVAGAEMASDLNVSKRVANVYVEEAKRQKNPLLWRYALHFTSQMKHSSLAADVFTQGFADCCWSRDLHLDYIEYEPEKAIETVHLMVEKNLRTRGDLTHANVYREFANIDIDIYANQYRVEEEEVAVAKEEEEHDDYASVMLV